MDIIWTENGIVKIVFTKVKNILRGNKFMKVVLYTTNCPKCKILETKMKQKNIKFETVTDLDVMNEKGFMEAPMLEVDGQTMNFVTANTWVNGR